MAIYIFHPSFPEASLDWEAGVGLGPRLAQPPWSTVTLGHSSLQASPLNSLDQAKRSPRSLLALHLQIALGPSLTTPAIYKAVLKGRQLRSVHGFFQFCNLAAPEIQMKR